MGRIAIRFISVSPDTPACRACSCPLYSSRSWSCIANGSLRTTLSCGERVKACTSPLVVADRDVEIVEDHRDSRYRWSVRRRNREGQLLAATATAAPAATASAAGHRREGRGSGPVACRVVAASDALQVARCRVAGAALAGTVEPRFSRLRVTRDDLLRLKNGRAAERIVDPARG